MINCHYCNFSCEEYTDLAKHVVANKKDQHRHGLKWASSFLLKVNMLNQKKDLQGRIPLTTEERESKESCERELSGRVKTVNTFCPNCSRKNLMVLPVEYTDSGIAWKIGTTLVVNCPSCRRNN